MATPCDTGGTPTAVVAIATGPAANDARICMSEPSAGAHGYALGRPTRQAKCLTIGAVSCPAPAEVAASSWL
jgi:hypothetical protein